MKNGFRLIATSLVAVASIPCVVYAGGEPAQIFEVASATTTTTDGSCVSDAALSPFQRRLLEKYDQSPQMLMQYVWRTRAIYLLDRMETAQWAEFYRRTSHKC